MDGLKSGSVLFDELKQGLSNNLIIKQETERALQQNLFNANPSDRGNRFIFGSGVEWVIAALCHAINIPLIPAGHHQVDFDLVNIADPGFSGWSIKSQSSKSSAPFRISNGMGGAGKGLKNETLFISPHLEGIVYVNPSIHKDVANACLNKQDAMILPLAAVLTHRDNHNDCFIPLIIPRNLGHISDDPFKNYAKNLLDNDDFPHLRKIFIGY